MVGAVVLGAGGVLVPSLYGCAPQRGQTTADSGRDTAGETAVWPEAGGPADDAAPEDTNRQASEACSIPSGSLCIAEYAGNTIAVVDPTLETVLFRVAAGENPAALAIGANRLYAASSGTAEVYAFDRNDARAPVAIAVSEQPLGLALDEQRGRLYVACYFGSHIAAVDTGLLTMVGCTVLDPTGYRNRTDPPPCCQTSPGVGRRPVAVAVAPDGSIVYSANYGTYDVATVDALTAQETGAFDGVVGPRQLAVSRDGELLLLAGVGGEDEERVGDLMVIDRLTGTRLRKVPVGEGVAGVCLTPDGALAVATARDEGVVVVLDCATWEERGRCQLDAGIEALAVGSTGDVAYVANARTGRVSAVDLATCEVVAYRDGFANPKALAVAG